MSEEKTKKCPYCSEEILDTAIKCKHCGEFINKEPEKGKPEKKKTITSLLSKKKTEQEIKKDQKTSCLGLIIIVITIIIAWYGFGLGDSGSNTEGKAQKATSKDGDVAAVCAQNYIKMFLKSPGSAKFPWNLTSTALGGNKYKVNNYVDSQNSFGALIRTYYSCDVTVLNAKEFQCDTTCEIEE